MYATAISLEKEGQYLEVSPWAQRHRPGALGQLSAVTDGFE